MNTAKLIIELSNSVCIGHHKQAMQKAAEFLNPFAKVTEYNDFLKAEINKGSNYTLMLDAHIDEVGMIITSKDENGFLTVSPVGSVDSRFLPATPVTVLGKSEIPGVFTSVPPHLKKENVLPSFDNCFVDVGKNSSLTESGDYIVYATKAEVLNKNRISGKSLDNRAGVAAVLNAAKMLYESDLKINIVVILTCGEELGLRGAKTAAYSVKADECIAVDVSFGDYPNIPSHKTAPLGSGTMIGISPVLNKNIYTSLKTLANENNIPYTVEVMGGTTSTNADAVSVTCEGIPCGLLSIPLRNMHTPVEIVDINDVEATSKLIFAYAKKGGLK